jgi:hypothetical protein
MKTSCKTLAATFAVLLLTLLCAPGSRAQCGSYQKAAIGGAWFAHPGQAMLVEAALNNDDHDNEPGIVGFWHFKMSIAGQTIDAGDQQWHSDGTEVLNSGGRSPLTGNICFGVWKRAGSYRYKLNHRGIGFDAKGSAVTSVDTIEFDLTLSRDGNSYSGTFTITSYDKDGNPMPPPVSGNVTGTRITVEDTNPGSLF